MLNSTRRSELHWGWICVLVFSLLAGCTPSPGITPASPKLPATSPGMVQATAPAVHALSTASPTTGVASLPAPTQALLPSDTPALNPIPASGLPDPSQATWRPVVDGLLRPVGVTFAPDGSDRLYVLEQDGVVRLVDGGQLSPYPFLNLSDRVGGRGSEQGLLGLAFHPDFAHNGFLYVNYTDLEGNTVIARFTAAPGNPPSADPGSELRLLQVTQPFANHNGGETVFGPDGYLYLGLGDGGSGGDPMGNAQSTQTLLGKILRLDVDSGEPYAIPPGNPFTAGGGLPEVWALGLRNPWRFTFDHQTGDLYIADVGQNAWEEIDFVPAGIPAGANFGWDYFEGDVPFEGAPPQGSTFISPAFVYGHEKGCSVTGGVVYRGSQLPEWQGVYLFGDYCSGIVWGMRRGSDGAWQVAELYDLQGNITSFGEDASGEALLVLHNGAVLRLER